MGTIRQQLTRRLLVAAFLLAGGGGLAIYWCARVALQTQFDNTLRTKAQALAAVIEWKGNQVDIELSPEQKQGLQAPSGPDFFELWCTNGVSIHRSVSLGDRHLVLPGAWPWVGDSGWDVGSSIRVLVFQFPPHLSDENDVSTSAPPLILAMATVRGGLDRTLATLLAVIGGGVTLMLVATLLLVPRLLDRELAPLQRLAQHAARIDSANLALRFPTHGLPGELVPIGTRLNELLARLESAFERERRFSEDVAHEFRTPIAELRGVAELAMKLPDTRSAETDRDILAIAMQLESIIERLLALARSERGQLPLRRERVALAEVVGEAIRPHRARAASRNQELRVSVPSDLTVDTDPHLLRTILGNLVDNAVEYGPPGRPIDLAASAVDARFQVCVSNAVQDLTPADLPHLFDRFWRKDPARSAGGHAGLGLSLARALAHRLDCQLDAALNEEYHLVMRLEGGREHSPQENTNHPGKKQA